MITQVNHEVRAFTEIILGCDGCAFGSKLEGSGLLGMVCLRYLDNNDTPDIPYRVTERVVVKLDGKQVDEGIGSTSFRKYSGDGVCGGRCPNFTGIKMTELELTKHIRSCMNDENSKRIVKVL